MENNAMKNSVEKFNRRSSSPVISNEDFVVLAAAPLGTAGLFNAAANHFATSGSSISTINSIRHHNGAITRSGSAGGMCTSDSQLNIQVASPGPTNERVAHSLAGKINIYMSKY